MSDVEKADAAAAAEDVSLSDSTTAHTPAAPPPQEAEAPAFQYEFAGHCPCCDTDQLFRAYSEWFRDSLVCWNCMSTVRERAVALVMNETLPNWRHLAIHQSSPSERGISLRLRECAPNYISSQYYPDQPLGENIGGYRNEDLENQTFGDCVFDLVVTLDVMEHVFHPEKAYSEVYRTLKPGGYYIHTFPIQKWRAEAAACTARLTPDGQVEHLIETPEYHGNPISDKGSLVTFYYGYDISKQIAEWAPFDVRIIRFWDQYHGVIGEYTDVTVCRKPLI
ncbi:class I SAM-dependent methyltransferase [Methylocystis rosea]|uniref:class I SAM-dependent methyltransferase n=1 Tax=Methylocystis rosea TaxID=173366 RepID=UPI0003720ECE|nr:methyltransferase domain-containing protein [Methylocystis rosea]